MSIWNDLSWVEGIRTPFFNFFFYNVSLTGYPIFLFLFIAFGYFFWSPQRFSRVAMLLFISAVINYAYTRAIIDEELNVNLCYVDHCKGNDIPGVSAHNVTFGLHYNPTKNSRLILTQKYRSQQFAHNDFRNIFTQKQPQKPPRLARLQIVLGSLGPLLTKKSAPGGCGEHFSAFRPHQARTCTHHTCIICAIRRLSTQSGSKVTPKWP